MAYSLAYLSQKKPILDPMVLDFLRYRMHLYKIGFNSNGEIVDTITPGLLKEGFVRLILSQDYTWFCENLNVKPNNYSLKYYLDYLLKTCYTMAKQFKHEDEITAIQEKIKKIAPNEVFTEWDLAYPKTFVCD
jgi:hypothetical protein